MTRSAKANITILIEALARSAVGKNKAEHREKAKIELDFTSGTGLGQIDRFWCSKGRSLAVGSEDIDLFDFAGEDVGGGAGNDAIGQAMALAEIAGILVVNNDDDGTLRIGGKGDTTAFNTLFNADDDALIVVPPRGVALIATRAAAAFAVADTSNHILKVEAVTADVGDWDLYIIGRSA